MKKADNVGAGADGPADWLTSPTPAGFEVHLTTDGTTYAFSPKDTVDPCLFGFFSDHKGTIFEGRVIQ